MVILEFDSGKKRGRLNIGERQYFVRGKWIVGQMSVYISDRSSNFTPHIGTSGQINTANLWNRSDLKWSRRSFCWKRRDCLPVYETNRVFITSRLPTLVPCNSMGKVYAVVYRFIGECSTHSRSFMFEVNLISVIRSSATFCTIMAGITLMLFAWNVYMYTNS